jgi:hypothetical protein
MQIKSFKIRELKRAKYQKISTIKNKKIKDQLRKITSFSF